MTVVHEAIADDQALAIAETTGLRYLTGADSEDEVEDLVLDFLEQVA